VQKLDAGNNRNSIYLAMTSPSYHDENDGRISARKITLLKGTIVYNRRRSQRSQLLHKFDTAFCRDMFDDSDGPFLIAAIRQGLFVDVQKARAGVGRRTK